MRAAAPSLLGLASDQLDILLLSQGGKSGFERATAIARCGSACWLTGET